MLVVGLTGGVGSGKSTVANLFATYHIPILDADVIARDIVAPGEAAYQAIVAHYGAEILTKENTLDRPALRKIIFEQEHERKWLEALLHPIIRERIASRLGLLEAPYCLVVIPLLAESPPFPFIDRVLVVDCPIEQQKARLAHRDQAPSPLIDSMINAQVQREERLAIANDVIVNDGSMEDLASQVAKLHEIYQKSRPFSTNTAD